MSRNIKKIAGNFIKKHKLFKDDYSALKKAAADTGYTIIEYNSVLNEGDTETIIQNLGLGEVALRSRGFTYVSKDHRLIFVHEDLSDEEKKIVLAHELGHIVCEHFSVLNVIGQDVKEEFEANEFAHYLLHRSAFRKIKGDVAAHKKAACILIAVALALTGVLTAFLITNNKSANKVDLYITETGKCYHKKTCVYIANKTNVKKLSEDDLEKGTYRACKICLPDENNHH